MTEPEISVWTGGKMSSDDALDKLQRDGFPVSQIVVRGYPPRPYYNAVQAAPPKTEATGSFRSRKPGEFENVVKARYAADERVWLDTCIFHAKKLAANEAIRLLIGHATMRARPTEWLEAKGNERALFRLAEEFCRFAPDCKLAYVFGAPEMTSDVSRQGALGLPGGAPRDCLPGAQPYRSMAFRSTTLGFFERPDAMLPIIVAHDAYAVVFHGRCVEGGSIAVGVMPTRETVGVVGASQKQLVERAKEILGVTESGDFRARAGEVLEGAATPNFDANDFRARLALRRLLAKSDNPQ